MAASLRALPLLPSYRGDGASGGAVQILYASGIIFIYFTCCLQTHGGEKSLCLQDVASHPQNQSANQVRVKSQISCQAPTRFSHYFLQWRVAHAQYETVVCQAFIQLMIIR